MIFQSVGSRLFVFGSFFFSSSYSIPPPCARVISLSPGTNWWKTKAVNAKAFERERVSEIPWSRNVDRQTTPF